MTTNDTMMNCNFMTTTKIKFPILKEANRYNIPYILEINNNTNEVYFRNRDGGMMTSRPLRDYQRWKDNSEHFVRHYIYDDGSKPWKTPYKPGNPSKKTLENYIKAINKIVKLCKGKKIVFHDLIICGKRQEYFDIVNSASWKESPNGCYRKPLQKKLDKLLEVYNEDYLDVWTVDGWTYNGYLSRPMYDEDGNIYFK